MKLFSIASPLYLLQGMRLLLLPGIRRYVIIPMLINILLFSLLIALGISQFSLLVDTYMPSLPEWLQWIAWLIWPVFIIGFIAVASLLSLMMANLIAAPFNGYLADAILRHLQGHETDTHDTDVSILKTIGPMLSSEINKLRYFIVRALPLLILFIIPGINLLAPFLWLIFSAWLLALEYLDYPMSSRGLLFEDVRQQVKQHPITAFSFGAGVLLFTVIPVINFFIMPIAVAGATILYVEKMSGDNTQA